MSCVWMQVWWWWAGEGGHPVSQLRKVVTTPVGGGTLWGGGRLTVDGGIQDAEAIILQGLDCGQGGAGGGAEQEGVRCWRPLACGRG